MTHLKFNATLRFALLVAAALLCANESSAQPQSSSPQQQNAQTADQTAQEAALKEIKELLQLYITQAEQGNYAESAQTATRALQLIEKRYGKGNFVYTELVGNIGYINYLKKDYAAAERMYMSELEVYAENAAAFKDEMRARAAGRFKGQNGKIRTLAFRVFYEGERARGVSLAKRLLEANEKFFGADAPEIAEPLSTLATLYSLQGDAAQTVALSERELTIKEKAYGADALELTDTLRSLGNSYDSKGDLAGAERALQRAVTILEKNSKTETAEFADTLDELGDVYAHKNDDERAAALKRRAIAIGERFAATNKRGYIVLLINFASFNVKHGNPDEARTALVRALELIQKDYDEKNPNGNDLLLAKISTNLAEIYMRQGNAKDALPLYQTSLEAQEKIYGAKSSKVASATNNIARASEALGDFETAEKCFRRALAVFEESEGEDGYDVGIALRNLALLLAHKGDIKSALPLVARYEEIQEKYIARNLKVGSEKEKQLFLEAFAADTEATVSLHLNNAPGDADAALLALTAVLRRKGRALDVMTDQIANLRRRASAEDRALLDKLSQAMTRRSSLSNEGANARSAVAQLDAQIEKLQTQIGERNAEFRAQSQPVTIEAVQSAIPSDFALVEIVAYRPYDPNPTAAKHFGAARYAAYVLRAKGDPSFVELGAAAAIDALAANLRASLADPKSSNAREAARALDERTMQRVRPLLGASKQVFLSPDGALNLVPFAALVDEGGKYLVENYSITYLTSGRDLLRLQTKTNSDEKTLVLANPIFDMNRKAGASDASKRELSLGVELKNETTYTAIDFTKLKYAPLEGTAAEAKSLAALLPDAKVLTGADATEAAIKSAHRPLILHIATHGFFLSNQNNNASDATRTLGLSDELSSPQRVAENPLLRSGLILAGVNQRQSGAGEDGVLTALEASGLDLWGTKLIVLSACETGLGDVKNGAGVYGLRRAFVLAGSETQVMSLWQVSDAATRDLMTEYYTRLQRGEGRAEALRRVQLAMLADAKRAHPFYWAAFIQSGEWKSLN